jgi:hypothetical protein
LVLGSLGWILRIENGGGSVDAPVMWPPLWHPCLPKIYLGGPEYREDIKLYGIYEIVHQEIF